MRSVSAYLNLKEAKRKKYRKKYEGRCKKIKLHLPLRRDVGQKLSELLNLDYDRRQVEFGWEKVRHFEQEKRRERRSDKAVVDGVPEGSPTTFQLEKMLIASTRV